MTAVSIIERLDDFEKEWIIGWKGPRGAAYNVVAMSVYRKGLLKGLQDWRLNDLGEEVKAILSAN